MAETRRPDELEQPAPPIPNDPLTRIVEIMSSIGTVWIFALMVLVVADVAGRDIFRRPIVGVAEIAGNSIVGIVFLQLAAAVNSGRMTRADFLLDMLGGPQARIVQFLEGAFSFLGVVAMAIIAWAAYPNVVGAWMRNEFFGVQGLFTFPTWPVHGLIFVGATMAAIIYLRLVYRFLMAATASRSDAGSRA